MNLLGRDELTRENVMEVLRKNMFDTKSDYTKAVWYEGDSEHWSLADLFIRQYLNNGCNGFGMVNVENVYSWLVSIKDFLVKENMVSRTGVNNSGFQLWSDYGFEVDEQ